MAALAVLLALSDALLAVVTLMWWLQPEAAVGIVARLSGHHRDLARGELSEHDHARLVWAARVARVPLLVLLFLWSFAVGAVLGFSRPAA
ncbi:hypothetical protein L6R53_24905 [Myxococcota bacterium]|nr:hypothetical protein [Myxococcota bacterium]